MIRKIKSRSVVSDLKNPDGEIVQGGIEIADLLNDFLPRYI